MNLIFLISLTSLFVILVWYIVSPILEGTTNIPEQINQDELMRKKTVLMRQIKELEMDDHIGNISNDDFIDNRNGLKNEISKLLENIN